jgi:branched-chain amino acid ABC transporter, ATP-binding protein
MNPKETEDLMNTIKLIRDKFGIAVLLIEHDMKLVLGICERLVVLNYGQILASGDPQEVINNPKVVEAYLGKEEDE